mmetsp:Transcript_14671/g.61922  ORF Transcript_14671/g.61922 Transcript_14671/m.61922 type:complete len:292 (+) Transcript_14671:1161-2036(+)
MVTRTSTGSKTISVPALTASFADESPPSARESRLDVSAVHTFRFQRRSSTRRRFSERRASSAKASSPGRRKLRERFSSSSARSAPTSAGTRENQLRSSVRTRSVGASAARPGSSESSFRLKSSEVSRSGGRSNDSALGGNARRFRSRNRASKTSDASTKGSSQDSDSSAVPRDASASFFVFSFFVSVPVPRGAEFATSSLAEFVFRAFSSIFWNTASTTSTSSGVHWLAAWQSASDRVTMRPSRSAACRSRSSASSESANDVPLAPPFVGCATIHQSGSRGFQNLCAGKRG